MNPIITNQNPIKNIVRPHPDITIRFGAALKSIRKQRGFSQEVLAERADLHRTYISDVERGSRNLSLKNIAKLACAMDVPIAALFPLDAPEARSSMNHA